MYLSIVVLSRVRTVSCCGSLVVIRRSFIPWHQSIRRLNLQRPCPSCISSTSQTVTSGSCALLWIMDRRWKCMHASVCNSNSNSHDSIYGAVIIAVHCHCESSPGSSDECSTQCQVAADLLGRADQPEPIDPPIDSYSDYIHHRHLLLLSPRADTQCTIPRRVEG